MTQNLSFTKIQALKLLKSHREPLNSQFFANNFSISSKTVRNELNELNDIISQNGARIISKTGVGYSLIIDEDDKFDFFCETRLNNYEFAEQFSNSFERAHYIVRYLLCAQDYVKIEEIEDQLFINRTTVVANLRKAKEILAEFEITVINKSKHGLLIKGFEHNVRACLNYEHYYNINRSINVKDVEKYNDLYDASIIITQHIRNMIINYQNAYAKNNLSDQSINIITRAIYIAYVRNFNNNNLCFDIKTRRRFSSRNSYYLAKNLLDKCAEFLHFNFTVDDIIEITIYIVGYRILLDTHNITYTDDFLKTRDLALELIEYLERINGFQYIGKDINLADDISFHLSQIMIRSEFKLRTCNYLSQGKFSLMADKLAVQAALFIKETLNTNIDKDEVYRLSLLIYPIFGRYPFQFKKIKAILVPDINKSVGYGIAERLKRNYSSILESIEVYEYYELKEIDLNQFQVLFTSLKSDNFDFIGSSMKIIYLDIFFDENDKVEIRQQLFSLVIKNVFDYRQFFTKKNVYYNLCLNSKDQCLREFIKIIEQQETVSDGLLEDLKIVDNIYPSREQDNVTFISPIFSHTTNAAVYVFVLKRPITWNVKKVQIIVYWDRGMNKNQAISFENESVPHTIYLLFADKNVINLLRNSDDPKKIVQVYRVLNDMVLANARSFK